MDKETVSKVKVSSSEYTREYYNSCHGAEEFKVEDGKIKLLKRMKICLDIAEIQPGMLIVDIGCGRGELIYHCGAGGCLAWGMDYSADAVDIAQKQLLENVSEEVRSLIAVQQADAENLPFPNDSVDRVFLLDVVEHIYPAHLAKIFLEIWRILKPGGRLVIHTMPNLYYYNYGYPIYRFFLRLYGIKLPKNPRDRWPYIHLHVNEQTPRRLRKQLIESGFRTRVWLQSFQSYEEEKNPILQVGMKFVTSTWLLKTIFCNDIIAVGEKK